MPKKSILFLIIFAFLASATLLSCNKEEDFRALLHIKTPIGSNISEVRKFCSSEKFKCNQSDTAGYLNQHTGKVIGVKSIWGVIKEVNIIPLTTTSFSAYWGFDKDGRLLDIWVWKTIDGL